MNSSTELNTLGLRSLTDHIDFDRYSWSSVEAGLLTVWRGFPAWWGISPWASPYWTAEVKP